MVLKTCNFVQNFWNGSREYFLLVEEWNGAYEVTRAYRNLKKKEITICEGYAVKDLDGVRRPTKKTDYIIFSLGSERATTAENTVVLKRPKPNEAITESEMDQLVHKGFWDFLNRYRAMAAKKMKTSDSDLIMAYVQVRDVSIGTHKMYNPVGFEGKELNLKIRGTFVPRETLPSLERFKDWGKIFVFESASVLGDFLPESGSFSVQIGETATSVFKVHGNEKAFEVGYGWGTGTFTGGVAAELGIDEASARAIIRLYFENNVSVKVKKWLEGRVNESVRELAGLLEPLKKKTKISRPKIYFSGRIKNFPGAAIRVDEELERKEYIIKKKNAALGFEPLIEQNALALLVFEYDLPKFEYLNRLLKRRVKWLIPNF